MAYTEEQKRAMIAAAVDYAPRIQHQTAILQRDIENLAAGRAKADDRIVELDQMVGTDLAVLQGQLSLLLLGLEVDPRPEWKKLAALVTDVIADASNLRARLRVDTSGSIPSVGGIVAGHEAAPIQGETVSDLDRAMDDRCRTRDAGEVCFLSNQVEPETSGGQAATRESLVNDVQDLILRAAVAWGDAITDTRIDKLFKTQSGWGLFWDIAMIVVGEGIGFVASRGAKALSKLPIDLSPKVAFGVAAVLDSKMASNGGQMVLKVVDRQMRDRAKSHAKEKANAKSVAEADFLVQLRTSIEDWQQAMTQEFQAQLDDADLLLFKEALEMATYASFKREVKLMLARWEGEVQVIGPGESWCGDLANDLRATWIRAPNGQQRLAIVSVGLGTMFTEWVSDDMQEAAIEATAARFGKAVGVIDLADVSDSYGGLARWKDELAKVAPQSTP